MLPFPFIVDERLDLLNPCTRTTTPCVWARKPYRRTTNSRSWIIYDGRLRRRSGHHVYNPSRLLVKQQCVTMRGIIGDATNGRERGAVRHAADGDSRAWLRLDPELRDMLNAGDASDEGGNMVFEVVFHYTVAPTDASQHAAGPRIKRQSRASGLVSRSRRRSSKIRTTPLGTRFTQSRSWS